MKLFLCAARGVEFPNWLTRIWKIYIEASSEFGPVNCPDGLNTFLQLPPGNSSLCGKVDRIYIPKTGGASEEPLWLTRSSSLVDQQSALSMTSSNRHYACSNLLHSNRKLVCAHTHTLGKFKHLQNVQKGTTPLSIQGNMSDVYLSILLSCILWTKAHWCPLKEK